MVCAESLTRACVEHELHDYLLYNSSDLALVLQRLVECTKLQMVQEKCEGLTWFGVMLDL